MKTQISTVLSILTAIVLAPFIAIFGLVMLGFTLGLTIIAAGAFVWMARGFEREAQKEAAASPPSAGVGLAQG